MIGGVGYTPAYLRSQIKEIKEYLVDKSAPFGVDLLLPQVNAFHLYDNSNMARVER